jgi:polygalacturonase
VRDVTFEHVCMRNEAHPLVFDTFYSDKPGTLLPNFRAITVRDFHYVAGGRFGTGKSIFRGYRAGETRLPVEITLDGIVFDGGAPRLSGNEQDARLTLKGRNAFADVIQSSPIKNLTVTIASDGITAVRDCSAAFVPLGTLLAGGDVR